MRIFLFLSFLLILFSSVSSAQEQEKELDESNETIGTKQSGDNEARIYAEEITRQSFDLNGTQEAAWKWYELPESVDCGKRPECESKIEIEKLENK